MEIAAQPGQLGEPVPQVHYLVLKHELHPSARRLTPAPNSHNLLDLRQLQPDELSLLDEPEHLHCLGIVQSIAIRTSLGRRDETFPLVEADRLPRQADLSSDSTYSHATFCHASTWLTV